MGDVMFARVMSSTLSPDKADTFGRTMRDTVIPQAQCLQGFKGGYWLIDRVNGKVLGVTLFESEQALKASEAQADRIREQASREIGELVPTFESYEVIASVGSGESLAAYRVPFHAAHTRRSRGSAHESLGPTTSAVTERARHLRCRARPFSFPF
jgi:hypothetical protein